MLPSEFVLPGERNSTHVLRGALGAVGMSPDPSFTHSADLLELPRARRACVVLVDGLGLRQLRDRSGHFPFLRSRSVKELTTVVPSTTAAAVTSVGTGAMPGQTGMLGYTVRHPSGSLMNLIKWDDGLVRPQDWQRMPTLGEQVTHPERFVAVGPARFVGSGLNNAAMRGARDCSAELLAARVDVAVDELRSGRADVVYLYWGEIDHVGHVAGWGSWDWGVEATATDQQLDRLARSLPPDTLLLITADHGMVDVADRVDMRASAALAADVEAVAGEPRTTHLYTAQPEAVAARWRQELGERAWVIDHARALEVFAPVAQRFTDVIGDVVVFARGRTVVLDPASQTEASMALTGVHGSLTADEMLVPLAVEVI